MAYLRLKPQQLLRILEILGILSSTSPKPVSGRYSILRNIIWCLTFVNLIFQLIGDFLFFFHCQDSIMMLKTIFISACVTDAVLNLIICHVQKERLQYLLNEIENYLQTGDENDINILQKHVDRYTLILIVNTLLLSCAGMIIFVRPLITKDYFPVDVWYPASFTMTPFRRCIIYILQVLTGIECVLCLNTDISIALFFCYSAARLEVLQRNLQNTKTKDYIRKCIMQHQDIIKFVNLTQVTVQYLILKLNLTMGTAAVCSLFPLIIDQPLVVKGQFVFTFLSACERFYISAWSATDLSEMILEQKSSI
ncbi:PREDICTED: uncharacterized protein LOC105567296 isoform X2 [Vollenhovia emeryi]|uniref:uncharacterized protein LOC105567296 isoform X2 n=1 Tax=Vollenhovia emeryi TaxID=411798 RepID=UPI0005F4FB4E|nr:PREDICTED: uncharacterized protein LOC105567296 isoform X2 [Vollenhovia emeryi]